MTDVQKAFDVYGAKPKGKDRLSKILDSWGRSSRVWEWIGSGQKGDRQIQCLAELSDSCTSFDDAILLINQAIYHRLIRDCSRLEERRPRMTFLDVVAAAAREFPCNEYPKKPFQADCIPLVCEALSDDDKKSMGLEFDAYGMIYDAVTMSPANAKVAWSRALHNSVASDMRGAYAEFMDLEQKVLDKWRINDLNHIFQTRIERRVRYWTTNTLREVWEVAQLIDRESAEQEFSMIIDMRLAHTPTGTRALTLTVDDAKSLLLRLRDGARGSTEAHRRQEIQPRRNPTSACNDPHRGRDSRVADTPQALLADEATDETNSSVSSLRSERRASPGSGTLTDQGVLDCTGSSDVALAGSSDLITSALSRDPPANRQQTKQSARERYQLIEPSGPSVQKLDQLLPRLKTSVSDARAAEAEISNVDEELRKLEEERKHLKQRRRAAYEQRRQARKLAEEIHPEAKVIVEEEPALGAEPTLNAFLKQVRQWNTVNVKQESIEESEAA